MSNQNPTNNRSTQDIAAICNVPHPYIVEIATQKGFITGDCRELTPQQASVVLKQVECANIQLASSHEPTIDEDAPIFSIKDVYEMMNAVIEDVKIDKQCAYTDDCCVYSINEVRAVMNEVLGK
jgi:hypothetical protein